jgi:serine protease Do
MKLRRKLWRYALVLLAAGIIFGSGLQMATASKEDPVRMIPANFSDIADTVRDGVVNIRTVINSKGAGPVFNHFFGNPFGDNNPFGGSPNIKPKSAPDGHFKQQSLGSGFVVDKQGYIVTNNHVIENADEIKVKLADGKEYEAKVVGRDPNTDLALIKIDDANGLSALSMGNSDALRVGTWVVAVGSPFGLEQTVTAGIVSAKGRVIGAGPYDDFIQTDASINPGNSGGPLLNMKGEVVGINTAIMSRSGGNNGIGFAIPINEAKGIIEQLKDKGEVTRAWMGVGIQDLSPDLASYYHLKDQKGALVTKVYEGDPADKAGIQINDIIIEANGKQVSSRELSRTIANAPVGERIPITILRDGKEKTLYVELVKRNDMDKTVKVGLKNSGGLGLRIMALDPATAQQMGLPENEKGVLVTDVQPGGKGQLAGIEEGDVIKEVNHQAVKTPEEMKAQIEAVKSGDTAQLLVKRAGEGLMVLKVAV